MILTINILFNDTRLGHHQNKVVRLWIGKVTTMVGGY